MRWLLLLQPWFVGILRTPRGSSGRSFVKVALFSLLCAVFWLLAFWAFWRVLEYFKGIDLLGEVLAAKLLSMILLTFFALLVVSNIISSLSTHFLSEDLNFLMAQPLPFKWIHRAKMVEMAVSSSWMVMLFGAPVFLAYGLVFEAPLTYYLIVVSAIAAFVCVASFLGASAVLLLSNLFPARRAKETMAFMAVSFGVFLYILIRFMNPEKWADPEAFPEVLQYLASLRSPQFPLLPSHWVTEAMLPSLLGREGRPLFYLGLLWSTAASLAVMTGWLSETLYPRAWSRAQHVGKTHPQKRDILWKAMRWMLYIFPLRYRVIIDKDLKTFVRDARQWSQMLLMGALMVVYLYNFSVLPLDEVDWWGGWYIRHLLGFFNLALAGFVITAVAARFAFPSLSMEGRAIWIPMSTPLPPKEILWAKFWGNWLPLITISLILVGVSNALLGVSLPMMIMSLGTISLCGFGIVGMAVGMGASSPDFEVDDPAKIATTPGGVYFMIMGVGFVLGVVLLEALPLYIVFYSKFHGLSLGWLEWLIGFGSLAGVVLIWLSAFWLPMNRGARELSQRDAWP